MSTRASTTNGSVETSYAEVVRTASMLALPHMPQDDEVKKFRVGDKSGSGVRSETSTTLSAQLMAPATSLGFATMPSVTRKPSARSRSWPGVRIVTEIGVASARISRGSSTASVSGRVTV